MINNLKIEKPNKKSLYYLGAVLIIAILVGIGYFYYLSKIEVKAPEEISEELQKQRIIEQQLEALDQMRGDTQSLTKQEINQQIKELDKKRQENSLSEEEIQKQLEELDKLR